MACNDLQQWFQHAEYFTGDPVIRGDVKIHNQWLQPNCCSIKQLCIACPI